MMQWLIPRMLGLWLALMLVIGASVIIGHQQPDISSVLQLGNCDLPCWIGIVPGRTTLQEARMRVEQTFGHPRGCHEL